MPKTHRSRSRAPHSFPSHLLPSDFLSKLCLFWSKSYGAFRHLSLNVTREVCSYLGYLSTFVNVDSYGVWVLNRTKWRWERVLALRKCRKGFNFGSCVNISRRQVFLCGGTFIVELGSYFAERHAVIADSGVRKLRHMVVPRAAHEVIYSEKTLAAYVFGGYSQVKTALSSAEMYDFRTMKWRKLPDMPHISGPVYLCLFTTSIYITTREMTCERFSTLTHTYTLLPLEPPASHYDAESPFIYDNKLCVVYHSYDQWDVQTGGLVRHTKEGEYYCSYPVVVDGKWVYLMQGR